MKKVLLLLVILCLSVSAISAQDDVLTVDTSQSLGPISPFVYGSNLGQNAIIPLSMMDTAAAAGINFARLGGGDSDRFDVRNSVVDVFIYQARAIGAEPLMTVRLAGGSPEAAAEAVRYANIERGHNIRYWSIGNEPNIFGSTLGDDYTAERYNREWRAIAEAMLAVDPEIILVGPDITQYVPLSVDGENIVYSEGEDGGHPRDSEGKDWLIEFLRANGDLVDIISFHRYPYPGLGDTRDAIATIEDLRVNSREWDTIVPNWRQIILNTTGREYPIAVTEINSNSSLSCGGEASLDSFYNALWFADVLGRLIENQVDIAASWDMQGIGPRCYGLITSNSVRPIYYSYLMYTHFGSELVSANSTDPDVSIYAALREDGALTIIVINLGPETATRTLDLGDFEAGDDAEVWLFDGTHNAQLQNAIALTSGAQITVPAQSMTLYVIPAA
ncbi:MAG: hypothetical protein IAE89_15170 [Anaerolineae bacterium]|nr:hypothetical protein [Anaerolineae bacterium]